MSADFPNEAARCQRFLSERAQSNFEPRDGNGPAATRPPCYLMQNTRSKDRVRGTNSVKRAVAQLGRAPGSGPGGRGFKSHQPDELPPSQNVLLLRIAQREDQTTLRGLLREFG